MQLILGGEALMPADARHDLDGSFDDCVINALKTPPTPTGVTISKVEGAEDLIQELEELDIVPIVRRKSTPPSSMPRRA
eukprot:5763453-Pyramimonas_sp.AAC.1